MPDFRTMLPSKALSKQSRATAALLLCSLLATTATFAQPAAPTVRTLMKEQIAPNATAIWEAVSYVVNAEGTTETAPSTEADWEALRANAIALMGATRLLRELTLPVAEPGAAAAADFQYSPDEVAARRAQDPDGWLRTLDTLEANTLQTMSSISRRNVDAFTEVNASINDACRGCHALYWYRPVDGAR
jgi:hypothetical protein